MRFRRQTTEGFSARGAESAEKSGGCFPLRTPRLCATLLFCILHFAFCISALAQLDNPAFLAALPAKASPAATSGTTFYVDTGGNNANTGLSLAQAWQTTSYALTNAHFTNSFYTNATTIAWTGGSVFTDTNAIGFFGAAKYPITLCGSSASPAVISNYWMQSPGNWWGQTLIVYQPSQVTFSNLTFTGQQAWLVAQQSTNIGYTDLVLADTNGVNCTNNVVTNCTFQYSGGFGIHLYTASTGAISNMAINGCVFNSNVFSGIQTDAFTDNTNQNNITAASGTLVNIGITNCIISNIVGDVGNTGSGDGIFLVNVSNCIVTGCVVHDSGQSCENGSGGAAGILFARSYGTVATSNEVYNIHWNGSSDGNGIDFDNNCQNCTAQYNFVHGCDGSAYQMWNSYGGSVWRFNVGISNGNKVDFAEMRWGNSGNTPTNNQVYNNDFLSMVSGGQAIIITAAAGGSNIFVNNILFTTNNYAVNTADTTHVTFQTNDYWRGDGTAAKIDWNGTVYASASAWHTASGQEKASPFAADPKWVNGYTVLTNYPAQMSGITGWKLLSASSPLINQATGPYGFANGGIDFLGVNALGSTFNVGAVNASQ